MSEPASPISSTTEFYRPVEVFLAQPPRGRIWIYVVAFLLTVFTTLLVGARMEFNYQHGLPALSLNDDTLSVFPLRWGLGHPRNLLLGIPFSLTLMLILFVHEMGHYLYCRYYKVYATLPFFVPFPSLIGTLGAFIRIKSPIRSRSALFDIGIAGPIAGFVCACVALILGLSLSNGGPQALLSPDIQLGYPWIFSLIQTLLRPSVSLSRVSLNPIAIAAWVGMFATALNLLPGGQLDGGHIVYSISPRLHRVISNLTILVLIPLGLFRWAGWLLWAVLLAISGMRHPMVPEWPGISSGRKWLALFGIIMLLLTFTSTPFTHSSLIEVVKEFRSGQ